MKHHISIFVIVLLLTTGCLAQHPRTDVGGNYLLKTRWGGASPFNVGAPHANTLGCHSIALAQVMYFHHLAPHGHVSYKCSTGIPISEDFSGYRPQWDRFALADDPNAGSHAIQETARFMYYAAVVVRKDFGTDQYADANDRHKRSIESHFHCMVTPHVRKVTSTVDDALRSDPDLYAVMKAEIDASRPAVLYYDYKGGGHAVVVDGYVVKDGKTFFHANFGWLGSSDGWYLLAEDLPRSTKEIVVITFVPEKPGLQRNSQVNKT